MGQNKYSKYKDLPHICYACGRDKTSKNSKGRPNWLLNINTKNGNDVIGMLCSRCYNLYITYPKLKARGLFNTIYTYGAAKWGRVIYAGMRWKQRSGYCSLCPNNIHDGSCKRTNMHHWIYIRIFPWFGRIEVCRGCHSKIEWAKGTYQTRPNHWKERRQKLGISSTWSTRHWAKLNYDKPAPRD